VKALQAVTIVCQQSGCEYPATHLFRSATVAAYCEFHSKVEADRIGINLPMPVTSALHVTGSPGYSAVKTKSVA
jgi:hypothetical protein